MTKDEMRESLRRDTCYAFKRRMQHVEYSFKAYEALKAIGFRVKPPTDYYGYCFTCPRREQLPSIRKALGPLVMVGKEIADEAEGTIWVNLRPEGMHGVTIRYEVALPPSSKCKIVKSTSEYTSLVCER